MVASRILYGAAEEEIHVVNVKHVNSDGIHGTYIFRDVLSMDDLSARIGPIKASAPDLEWKLYYDHGKTIAYLISYKKEEAK